MPSITEPRSGIQYGWALDEDGWNVGMDANLLSIGRFAYHLSVKSRSLTAPPGSPTSGDTYIPAASATGPWAGKAGQVAVYTPAGYVFGVPRRGWTAVIEDEGPAGVGQLVVYTATNTWAVLNAATATALIAKDEGVTLTSSTNTLNFTGAGVTATNSGGVVTVNVPAVANLYAYTGNWTGKPAAGTFGRQALINDYGANGYSIWQDNVTRWTRDAPLRIYQNGNLNASVTGTTETLMQAIPVKGGSLGLNGEAVIKLALEFSATASIKTVWVRIGPGAFSASHPHIWVHNSGTGSNASASGVCGFVNRNSESVQKGTVTSYNWGYGTTTIALETAAINTAADFNIFISGYTNGSGSLTLLEASVDIIPK